MKKEYKVSDLFFNGWENLNEKQMITLIQLSDQLLRQPEGSTEYGLTIIGILRSLRKNYKLVDKINEAQAVDSFNELTFFQRNEDGTFKKPWYFFPVAGFNINGQNFTRPEMNGTLPMYNRSFQQLVYADSAFSGFCVLNYQLHSLSPGEGQGEAKELEKQMDEALCSLVAVLYTDPKSFDVANTEMHAKSVALKLTMVQRALVLHTYANARAFITERCPNLFPLSSEASAKEDQPPVFTGPMWLRLRYDLAKTEVFKGFKVASDALIYDALDYLEQEALDAITRTPNGQE